MTTADEPEVTVFAVYRVKDGWSRRTLRLPVSIMRELTDYETARKTPRARNILAVEVAADIEAIADNRAIEEWG